MSERIEVKAVILDYTPNAMQDSFDHGGFESYDASKLRILTPEELAGLELNIYHGSETPREGLWRTVGQRIVFEIAKDDLMGGTTLFNGAVTRLRADCSNDSRGQ
ncbi:hypothetical protein [Archangium sp.]|uniref:hypothetical protein n=1 Tax=Archangium sp. TaxID=1872627 RepID=UPI002D70DD8D|nr:hypothetical protein [Archangium sp.]HYO53141.1 hypothetical protein [Archangium sp.]